MINNILCALDGSEHAKQALSHAIDMASKSGATLVYIHALLRSADSAEFRHFAEIEGLDKRVQPELKRLQAIEGRLEFRYDDEPVASRVLVEVGEHILDNARRDAELAGIQGVKTVLVDGDPASGILRCINEQGIDLVIMGSRGLSDLKAIVLGSVSHKVMNRAPCTCIAVK